jgi:hypothetical protein
MAKRDPALLATIRYDRAQAYEQAGQKARQGGLRAPLRHRSELTRRSRSLGGAVSSSDRYLAFIDRHQVAWELAFAALADREIERGAETQTSPKIGIRPMASSTQEGNHQGDRASKAQEPTKSGQRERPRCPGGQVPMFDLGIARPAIGGWLPSLRGRA